MNLNYIECEGVECFHLAHFRDPVLVKCKIVLVLN
jgi:hypothetical protein